MRFSYDGLKETLAAAGVPAEPAEAYGFMLGFICGGGDLRNASRTGNFKRILEQFVFGDARISADLYGELRGFAERIAGELLDAQDVTLLLPGDGAPLGERIRAVRDAAASFLPGFSVTQKDLNRLGGDVREIVGDFVSISRLDPEVPEGEGAAAALEDDLVIVAEHLSVGAQICFEECAARLYPGRGAGAAADGGAPVKLSPEREEAHRREAALWEERAKGGA